MIPDRRQPRQRLTERNGALWDDEAFRAMLADWDSRPMRVYVRRLSRRPGVDELPRDGG